MHSRGRPRSNSAISLHELDGQLQSHVNHSSASSGTRGPPSQDRDQGLNGDQDDDNYKHSHESPEPRGEGSAGTAGSESGDASESSPSPSPSPSPPSRDTPASRLSKAWGSHVSCEVDFAAARDHLALERTFLGYLRTSMTMSMLGTAIAQLFSITEDGPGFGYTRVGKPLATLCFAFSIATILLGAIRSWRHQHSLMSGRALTGGFEIHLLGVGTCLLLLVFLGMMVAIDTIQAFHGDWVTSELYVKRSDERKPTNPRK